ncbi:hypothetical protein IQ250_18990, partial [Pseudanabaenaceae cyanobacterium LEGE 13415]|nr:hypothetical protein [Pseudanabaenaceae cyanobacterium LEGE 13415]
MTHRSTTPLQQKLLLTFLPIVLLPLATAGFWSGTVAHQRMMMQAELRLKNQSRLTAALTYKEIERKTALLKAIAVEPTVLKVVQDANQQSASLDKRSIAELETKFAQTKRLKQDEVLDGYLQDLSSIGSFAELFVTDQRGLNIAFTKPTSDFVQRDELWWQQGKQQRQWIGTPQFDDSTQKITIDLVQAILDPNTQAFIGMMKAGYD